MFPLVSKLKHFIALADSDVQALSPFMTARRSVPSNTDLLQEGQTYGVAFIIHDGWAVRYRLLPDGRRQIINFLIAGDSFGLGSIILNIADHTVATITPAVVSTVTAEDLLTLIRANPKLGAAFLWSAAQEEAILREHIVSVGRRTAYERVAHLLLELMTRLDMVGRVDDRQYELPLSQSLLADALGLSVVHVNRTLRRLQNDRLIRIDSRQIHIADLEQLKEIADFKRSFLHVAKDRRGSSPLDRLGR